MCGICKEGDRRAMERTINRMEAPVAEFNPETDCFRCAGTGIILVGQMAGQRAENCPDCKGTGRQQEGG